MPRPADDFRHFLAYARKSNSADCKLIAIAEAALAFADSDRVCEEAAEGDDMAAEIAAEQAHSAARENLINAVTEACAVTDEETET